jgi:hypothetical protein
MALSGSQITRIGGHGAGMAYAGFTAKTIALIKFLPRVIAVMGRTISTYILNREVEVGIVDRTGEVGITSTDRTIGTQRGKGE